MTKMVNEPLRRTVVVINPFGLHMRPATLFAELAGNLACDVTVWNGQKRANGKSLWDLVGLYALPGAELTVEVDGTDAREGLERLVEILSSPGDPEY
jgi:phosphocarrier protein HPr